MDNVSCVQGSAQALVIIHFLHISTASMNKKSGLPALQPVPIPLGLAWAERGMGTLHIRLLSQQGIVPLAAIHLSHRPAIH